MSNLLRRTVFGTVFVALVVAATLHRTLFLCIFLAFMMQMLREFYALTIGDGIKYRRSCAILSAILLFPLVYLYAEGLVGAEFVSLAWVPVIALMMSAVCLKDKSNLEPLAYLLAGLVYIALPLSLSPLLVFRGGEFDGTLLLSFFIIIWCGDVGAYALGTAFGQKPTSRKLCPEISPKKSWVGVFGGYVTALAGVLVLHACGFLSFGIGHCIVLATLLNLGGVFGDLFESMWKRRKNVKDSGSILPGHGGVLDRLDSSLIAMPLGAIYLAVAGLL